MRWASVFLLVRMRGQVVIPTRARPCSNPNSSRRRFASVSQILIPNSERMHFGELRTWQSAPTWFDSWLSAIVDACALAAVSWLDARWTPAPPIILIVGWTDATCRGLVMPPNMLAPDPAHLCSLLCGRLTRPPERPAASPPHITSNHAVTSRGVPFQT